jgi:hypothetical protein
MANTPVPNQNRRRYRIGASEIYAVWPLVVFAVLLIGIVYGIGIYESLFQLPTLAPVK